MAPQLIRGSAGERLAGQEYTAAELAARLNRQADILRANEGGVTFSGGEPLLQAEFVAEVIDQLSAVHVVLDTSGFGKKRDFLSLVDRCDLIFFDLKLIERAAHRYYTGRDNDLILDNLRTLHAAGTPFVVRVPLVPGVTDTDENLAAIARTVRGLSGLLYVELLPYNRAAGSKYPSVGKDFKPDYDETRPPNVNTMLFEQSGVKVCVA